jgi:hypothetical protein
VHSFHTLLADLATLTRNTVHLGAERTDTLLATPSKLQRRALDLLGISLAPVDSTPTANSGHINNLRSKPGKVRTNGILSAAP